MKKRLIFILFQLSFSAFAETKLDRATIDQYLKIQKEFNKNLCSFAQIKEFEELNKNYRGDGNYIPLLPNQDIDQKAIESNLILIDEKIRWIEINKATIETYKNFNELKDLVKTFENSLNVLLEKRKKHFFTDNLEEKEKVRRESMDEFKKFQGNLELFTKKAPFLLSFKFPLDHVDLRRSYDMFKFSNIEKEKSQSNSVYLKRKIVQDGSFDTTLTKTDSAIRASFDTFYLSVMRKSDRDFLTENERSDLVYLIRNLYLLLDLGPKAYAERFDEWKDRTLRSQEFYKGLLINQKDPKLQKEKIAELNEMLKARSKASSELKDFVLRREALTYEFWSKKSDLYQYLYTMETILYAEVGQIDAPHALERKDIAHVVYNRAENPKYNMILKSDSLYNYLPAKIDITKYKWLNVMFKEGEFSFTYFYIPGNLHIYCPDMSKIGQFLRKQNLRIAIDIYGKRNQEFKALRYYSRMSMTGRMEMDDLWGEYIEVPQSPGLIAKNSKALSQEYKEGNFKFFYNFKGLDKKNYYVIEINKRIYVVDAADSNKIYYYRNPHHFKYFAPLK